MHASDGYVQATCGVNAEMCAVFGTENERAFALGASTGGRHIGKVPEGN